MPAYDIAIIGGGVVGCSIAKHLREKADVSVAILEKEYHLAQHQSGRNSGVIHPGFNYPPGSLKAEFSTEGTKRLKAYCRTNDIPLDECGVIVVATNSAEEARLETLQQQATANGVKTELLESQDKIREHEPYAAGQAALYCPEAASIDSQKYVYTLAKDAESHGAEFYMGFEVEDFQPSNDTITIKSGSGTLTAEYVVNAAGLYADRLAQQFGVGQEYQIVPFRGEYYELVPDRRSLCQSMIYPTPDPSLPFLGVHFTRRTDGKVIIGPNAVLAFGREAYRNTDLNIGELKEVLSYEGFWRLMASPKMLFVAGKELKKSYRKHAFVDAARQLVPQVESDDFVRSYSGIRAQLVSNSGELIKEPVFEHGTRSTHILNAVSPGLTSSLPFGDRVSEEVLNRI